MDGSMSWLLISDEGAEEITMDINEKPIGDCTDEDIGETYEIMTGRDYKNGPGKVFGPNAETTKRVLEGKLNQKFDIINKSPHYNNHPSGVECIEVARCHNFRIGNAIKYIWRNGLKDSEPSAKDIKKAIYYIKDQLEYTDTEFGYFDDTDHPSGVDIDTICMHYNYFVGMALRILFFQGINGYDSDVEELEKTLLYLEKELKRIGE